MDTDLNEKLLTASFRFLSVRPRSTYETKKYLDEKIQKWREQDVGVVPKVLARLEELGYLNDRKFALWLLESRTGRKPRGARLIRQELAGKGIDKEIIEEVLSRNSGIPDELALAQKAVAKKAEHWRTLPLLKYKSKAYGFLLRRGFGSDTVRKIVDGMVKNDYNRNAP